MKLDACIIGAAKSATSSLSLTMARHPHVNFCKTKEPQYFRPGATNFIGPQDIQWAQKVVENPEDYESLFAIESTDRRLKMEASPYIDNPLALKSLFAHNGDIKLLVLLRDPVERAISSYRHLRRDNFEHLTFTAALAAERVRKARGWGPLYWYRELSDYKPQLEILLGIFDRQQIHFVLYEQLTETSEKELERIQRFLGIEIVPLELEMTNVGIMPKSRVWSQVVYGALNFGQKVSRYILPRSISSFVGRSALQAANKAVMTRIDIDESELTSLFDLYKDTPAIERMTGLPCSQYWQRKRQG